MRAEVLEDVEVIDCANKEARIRTLTYGAADPRDPRLGTSPAEVAMRATFTALIALLSVVSVGSLPAQTAQQISTGTRVRITMATAKPTIIIGELVSASDSAVSIRRAPDSGEVSIPRYLVYRLQVSGGLSRAQNAKKAGVIGMVVGGIVGFAAGEDCGPDDFICFPRPVTGFAGAGLGAGVGMLIGFVGGRAERWKDTAVPMRLSVVPTGGGSVSIVSRIAF